MPFVRRLLRFIVCSVVPLLAIQNLSAQERLTVAQTVARNITPGDTHRFSISLNDGDYVGISISQRVKVDLIILNPDGSVMRRLLGSPGDDKNTFALAAEGAGVYSFNIANPGEIAASYELLLQKVVSLNERFRGEVWSDPNPSPRIQVLRNQIASGQTNTESFWKEVAAEGTPLVEPLNDNYRLVTFLWRAQHDTRSVLVTGQIRVPGPTPNNLMHRIGDSDVWYLTLKLPKGARFTYQLVPNNPQKSDGTQAIGQADPFNSKRWDCPQGASKYRCVSIAELPDAVPQPWIISKSGTPAGRIEKQTIKSKIQKLERDFSVYLPAGYKSDGPANALLVLFDGDDLFLPDWQIQATLDNLIAAHKIPPTVVVMVDNLPNRRLVDLIANPEFADFVANELIPSVRTHYRVTRDSVRTVVSGVSAGGFAAAYLGLRHSEVFGNVLSQSGAFWWSPEHNGGVCASKCPEDGGRRPDPDSRDGRTEGNWITRQFVTSAKLPVRFYLEAGTFEVDKDGTGGNILEATRSLRDVLTAKGYEVHYQQFVGGHDDLVWRGTLADGLIALLGRP
jgi:enterochelin esterase-like enzyme